MNIIVNLIMVTLRKNKNISRYENVFRRDEVWIIQMERLDLRLCISSFMNATVDDNFAQRQSSFAIFSLRVAAPRKLL